VFTNPATGPLPDPDN